MKSEERLQTQVIEYLGYRLPKDSFFHHSPNEGRRHINFMMKLKKMGFKAGFPDIMIIVKDKPPIFIELKVGRNKPTPNQIKVGATLVELGCHYDVCYNLIEVENFLKKVLTNE